MLDFGSINWLAVVVGVIYSNLLGYFWYGALFGNRWLQIKGVTREEIDAQTDNRMFIVTVAASAIAMIALALVVGAFGAASFVDGLIVGVVAWVLAAVATYVHGFFEGVKAGVWAIYAFYQLVVWAVMGGVYAVWT